MQQWLCMIYIMIYSWLLTSFDIVLTLNKEIKNIPTRSGGLQGAQEGPWPRPRTYGSQKGPHT